MAREEPSAPDEPLDRTEFHFSLTMDLTLTMAITITMKPWLCTHVTIKQNFQLSSYLSLGHL